MSKLLFHGIFSPDLTYSLTLACMNAQSIRKFVSALFFVFLIFSGVSVGFATEPTMSVTIEETDNPIVQAMGVSGDSNLIPGQYIVINVFVYDRNEDFDYAEIDLSNIGGGQKVRMEHKNINDRPDEPNYEPVRVPGYYYLSVKAFIPLDFTAGMYMIKVAAYDVKGNVGTADHALVISCSDVFKPVCGVDGSTYQNLCQAKFNDIQVFHEGECIRDFQCPEEFDPVCGEDGDTYFNACHAKNVNIAIRHDGSCNEQPPVEVCTLQYEPVCGVDGNTYSNSCHARIAKVEMKHEGICDDGKPQEVCPEQFDPVCGIDGDTYYNSCHAKLANIAIVRDGYCDETKPLCDDPYAPVCGVDGKSYWSACDARVGGIAIRHEGDCEGAGTAIDTGTVTAPVCASPYVDYRGECLDPILACKNPPKHFVPSSCIDKIEDGRYIERYKFQCETGYTKREKDCIRIGREGLPIEVPPAGYEDEVITTFSEYVNPFPDTNIQSLEGQAASELYRRAVLGGFPDGEFKGVRNVNRAELAKFLLLARHGKIDSITNNGKFADVKEGEWYVTYVVHAANLGMINGYPDGLFRPAQTVNTAEFLKMISKTFGLQENLSYSYSDVLTDSWFARFVGVAEKYKLFPNRVSRLEPARELTRNEVAVAIYQYLKNR